MGGDDDVVQVRSAQKGGKKGVWVAYSPNADG